MIKTARHPHEEFMINGFDDKTILVTGAGGYIAGRLLSFLSNNKCKIIAITEKKIQLSNNVSKICN